MRVVPSSPRARRRLFRLGTVLVVVGGIAAALALVHGGKTPNAAPPRNAPRAQLVKQSKYVSPADRRGIDQTLDRFIPAALDRTSPATAWRLSGPDLTGGTTLRQWRHGTTPIPYYPARGKTFHDWTVIDSSPGSVDFSLLVHPRRGSQTSSWVFSGQMIKRHGRWLVNGLYTAAIMARPDKHGRHEVGPADYAAGGAAQGGQGGAPPPDNSARLGKTWLIALVAGIALLLLFPIAFGVASALRSRRSRMRYMRSESRTLPPLPRAPQTTSEPAGEGGVGAQPH